MELTDPGKMYANPHGACSAVQNLLGLNAVPGFEGMKYVGLFASGDCPVEDYDAGVLCVTFYIDSSNSLRVVVNSLDDGGASGYGKPEVTGAQARRKLLGAVTALREMGTKIHWEYFTRVMSLVGVYMVVE